MSERRPPSILPQEICELCIDALVDIAKDDEPGRKALAQCLRVSRLFWIRARRHIFSNVNIGSAFTGKRWSVEKRLVDLLAMMTGKGEKLPFPITKSIKSFTLNIVEEHYMYQLAIFRLPCLQAILQEGLEAKVLQKLSFTASFIHWKHLNPSTRELLHAFSRQPNLKSLSLSGFTYVPGRLLDGATIKELALDYICIGVSENSNSPHWFYIDALSFPPELDSLTVDNALRVPQVSSPSSHATVVLPFTHLKKLMTINHASINFETTMIIAARSCRTLEILHLVFHESFNYREIVPFDSKPFPKLRHLTSALFISASNMIPAIDFLCQFIQLAPILQTITIEMDLGSRVSLSEECWQTLEKALIQSRVPQVEFSVKVDRAARVDSEAVKGAALFAELTQEDTVEFQFNIHSSQENLFCGEG